MAVRNLRLMLGCFFLIAGVTLVVLYFAVPELNNRLNALFGAFVALVFAGVNLVKWYAGWMWSRQRATPVREPLQSDAPAPAAEYNPEFDFQSPPAPQNSPANPPAPGPQ
jgi:hypothetical protein